MRKVLFFSGFLMFELIVSQFLPMMAGDRYGAVKSISNILLYVCLSFIMINVGREFVLDKTRWKSYTRNYFHCVGLQSGRSGIDHFRTDFSSEPYLDSNFCALGEKNLL